jgi:hypothetical protein
MPRTKRANGAGTVYLKHGNFYGRWVTLDGGHANRKYVGGTTDDHEGVPGASGTHDEAG